MTRPINPADPRVISQLVDQLLAQARTPAPNPLRTQPRSPKKAPAPTPKEVTPVKLTKPKAPAAKTRKPAPKIRVPKPKPSVRIELAPGANLVHPTEYTPPRFSNAAPSPSAHYLDKGEMAPCHTCGGPCDEKEDRWGNWRRHRECLTLTQPWEKVRAAARWFSIPITDDEAWTTDLFIADYADGHPSAVYSTKDADRSPWSHVSLKSVVRAVMQAKQMLAEVEEPKACELGLCGWCGVEKSDDWIDAGHVRADNSKAPLCSTCGPLYDKLPGDPSSYWDDQRVGLAEALTGVQPDMLETFPVGLRAHAEVGGGTGEPWSHLPAEAVEEYRWQAWGRAGGRYAPDEHRAEAVARAAALEADRAARTVATQTSDPYGFSSQNKEADDE